MKDLTDSPIVKNILQMALPIAARMFFQTLYFLHVLFVPVASVALQAVFSLWLVRREFRLPLPATAESVPA
jgi:hypothetical protein